MGVFDTIVSFSGPGWPALRAVEDEIVAERLAGWAERYPDVPVQRHVVRDEPARQLVETSGGLSSWWSAVMAAADSPECRWAWSRGSSPVGPRAGHCCTRTSSVIVLGLNGYSWLVDC